MPAFTPPGLAVEPPGEDLAVAPCDAPVARRHLLDANDERLALTCAAHLDRPTERVTTVDLVVALEVLFVGIPAPAGVERQEADRVAGIDTQYRLEVTVEPTLDGAALERDVVDHPRGSWIQVSAGASSTRRPIRCPSSPRNSHSDTACSWPLSSGATSAGT